MSRHRSLTAALVSSLALVASLLLASPVHAATSEVNDWTCQPSAAQPRPVVLLHGLSANAEANWSFHGPRIAAAGYCVFSLTYGVGPWGPSSGGWVPIDESADEIGAFIDEVLLATGAAQVDLVGHSEGAFQSLYVTKVKEYADRVGRVVALAPPTHGTSVAGLVTLGYLLGGQSLVEAFTSLAQCPACADLVVGGGAVGLLTDGPIAQPGVTYTIVASRYDAVVTPPTTSFVKEPGVTNYFVQDRCPFDLVGHVGIAVDPTLTSMILRGLDGSSKITCGFGPPL
ncbi:esterase/lipase family protein [Nocardioides limicola]|uniref:esterase/lipase family protein n=1 Tax=Nocardioides limicola TaxID=2803368 RepID=UPI00193BDC78|nr:alpha/beta fold hydrolase [Nocardioides sp. DJM-14]